jgi:CelD/BcsL family acetyltransferase involved in cellulose biosynthesis
VAAQGKPAREHGVMRPGGVHPELEREWDALVDRTPEPSPWMRPGWIGPWWQSFGRGRLDVVTVRRDARLVALAPLVERRGVLSSVTNYHSPEFEFVAEDAPAAAELARILVTRSPRRLQLGFVAPDAAWLDVLRSAARGAGYRLAQRVLERSPYIDTSGDWGAYTGRRDAKLLREVRRRRRRLGDEGEVAIAVADGGERLDALLDEGFAVEAAGWKGTGGTAIASDPATTRFYRDVAAWAAARGSLRLAFLRLDGRALAFDFAIEENGRHFLLKTGYDPGYRRFAPAVLLRHAMIERAFAAGLATYEFLGRDEPWKLEWTSELRPRVLVQAFAASPAGRADLAAHRYGRPFAKRALALVGR